MTVESPQQVLDDLERQQSTVVACCKLIVGPTTMGDHQALVLSTLRMSFGVTPDGNLQKRQSSGRNAIIYPYR